MSDAAMSTARLCVECGTAPVASPRKGARFCGGKCRALASRRNRACAAYTALAAALPGGSIQWKHGLDPARLASAAPKLLDVARRAEAHLAAEGWLEETPGAGYLLRDIRAALREAGA